MKAILMAAGLGTRLLPVTAEIPKCMVPMKGVPLLGWWLKKLQKAGITEVMINLHHLKEIVVDYVNSQEWGLTVQFLHEKTLLGSQGTLEACRPYLQGEASFLVIYADNLTDIDLGQLKERHASHQLTGTMALFRSENPRACGIVGLDADQTVVAFEEKPSNPQSDLANAGIYMFNADVWAYIHAGKRPSDIGHDLLPRLVGRMGSFCIEGFFMDIGTPESLNKASRSWSYDY
ncbi:nucleotidyltransferase family protein [Paenibacillus sp. MMS18-CY102]|uniref:nucleotidyltransferase family protein n=1 Tax=Paenibacillus sp. MMS18-CY102 TaxID=2682849 RepID=UPI00136518F7|nr:nucleotidyltransferase family protein [Paenibacillus sp. MMS18-CY102]MWC30138.1 NTP transferase domain-containing protein [Paenibacillus sp. MMS18-CY102]